MYFNLAADGTVSQLELYHFADSTLRYQLQQVPGVAAVDIWGGDEREIQILVDRSRLEATGLSLKRVVEALKRENVTKVGGHLQSGHVDYVVRPLGELSQLEDIGTIVLRSDGAMPIYLKDVAEVRDGVKERLKQTRVNRTRGLVMAIRKQSGTNTVAVSDQLLSKLPQIRSRLPLTMRFNLMFDRADFIRRSIAQVQLSALLGGCIATLVLFLFLRSLRPTLIIALAIPLAVVATILIKPTLASTGCLWEDSPSVSACWWIMPLWCWKIFFATDNWVRHPDLQPLSALGKWVWPSPPRP